MASTYAEIISQPSVWKQILQNTNSDIPWGTELKSNKGLVSYFIGCGTSYYLAIAAAANYSRLTGTCARAITSSDLLFFPEAIPEYENVRAITISRSGETTETVWAAEHLVAKNIPTLAVTCKKDSSLTKQAHLSYSIEEANEESVVMTRSFTGMLLFLQYMAGVHAQDFGYIKELEKLPDICEKLITQYKDVIKECSLSDSYSTVTYLGQGAYYGLASESMLKLKEMSLTTTDVFHSLEFRHGPKSVANKNTLIIILMSESAKVHEYNLALELKKQGAKVVVLSEDLPGKMDGTKETSLLLRSGLSEYARMILYMPLTQLFAYERAIGKGNNPDSPRNLSKIVFLTNE